MSIKRQQRFNDLQQYIWGQWTLGHSTGLLRILTEFKTHQQLISSVIRDIYHVYNQLIPQSWDI